MARIIKREATGPFIIQEGDKKAICMCGLSNRQPFCNGNHAKIKNEEDRKLYQYEDGHRVQVEIREVQ